MISGLKHSVTYIFPPQIRRFSARKHTVLDVPTENTGTSITHRNVSEPANHMFLSCASHCLATATAKVDVVHQSPHVLYVTVRRPDVVLMLSGFTSTLLTLRHCVDA